LEEGSTEAIEVVKNENLDLHNQVNFLEGQLSTLKEEVDKRAVDSDRD